VQARYSADNQCDRLDRRLNQRRPKN
jgi:hypothetical protein